MLCKATEADLEQMVAFRRKTYGGTRQDAFCGLRQCTGHMDIPQLIGFHIRISGIINIAEYIHAAQIADK